MHGVAKGGLTPSLAPSEIDHGRVQGYSFYIILIEQSMSCMEATNGWSWSLALSYIARLRVLNIPEIYTP